MNSNITNNLAVDCSSADLLPLRTLTVWKIVVLIIATLTPISVVMATLPMGMAFGGPSTTLAFLLAGGVIGLFCIGYSEMVRCITRPGAFYNYIARGLGRSAGIAGAMVAMIGYPSGIIAAYAAGATVLSETLHSLGVTLSWNGSFILLAVSISLLVWRQIDLSALVSGIIVALEIVMIMALVLAIVISKGMAAFPTIIVSPAIFNYGSWEVAFIFAFLVYQGFEAGALYAPEAKNPERTIPRALLLSLIILTVIFFLCSWVLSSLSEPAALMSTIQAQGIVGFVLAAVSTYLGPVGLMMFSLVTILSVLACTLAVTNFMSRYLNGLAGDALLPSWLLRINRYGAPSNAAYTLIAWACLVCGSCKFLGIDPYTVLTPLGFGLGAIASTTLLVLSSLAVIIFFLRHHAAKRHWWRNFLAPLLALVALLASLFVELNGFGYITGSAEPLVNRLPWLIVLAMLFGFGWGQWLKRARPSIYANIAAGDTAEEAAQLRMRLRNQ